MTQEEFVKLKDKYSKKWADAHFNSFKGYDWDKFVNVQDASTYFDSTRRKYVLYKNNAIITPYLDETGNYKPYQGKDNILMAQYAEFDSEGDYNNFYAECQKDISTRWNIWEFTLYPSGEYESSFIWDNEAYLENLAKSVKTWLSSVYQYACERIQDRCSQLSIDYPSLVEMTVSFDASGLSFPAIFYTKNNPQMNFKLHLEQIYGCLYRPYEEEFLEYDAIRKLDEGDFRECQEKYQLTNEGALKGYYPRWNKLIFSLNPDDQYSFSDEKLKFEWREENV